MSDETGLVDIHGIAAGGAGVGRLPDGRAVFVHRTAPGDRARVRLTRQRPRWARGRVTELVEAGGPRTTPPCPHYADCGGCTLQHLEYGAQLQWKRTIVQDALDRIGGGSVEVGPVAPSPAQLGYRTRVSYTLRRLRNGRVVAGFHELDRPARVVDVDSCLLPAPPLQDAWTALRRAWGPGARRLPAGGSLRLTLRLAREGVVLVVGGGEGGGDPSALLEEVPTLVAVWQREGKGPPRLLAGEPDTTETWMGRAYPVRASAFLQVNPEAGQALQERVLELMADLPGRVVDAYCGVGAFGRALANEGREAVGIEADPEAVEAAGEDAPAGFTVVAGRVEDQLPGALPAPVVIVNPPRTGLDGAVVESLLAVPPNHLLYVSCDPATLARDVSRLAGAYRARQVETFDLFPQTAHVESLAVLERTVDAE